MSRDPVRAEREYYETMVEVDPFEQFLQACAQAQPQEPEEIRRFFEGVVLFPYDKELLLQAFLHLNIREVFPFCDRLLLFEKSPDLRGSTNQGKCDFIYLTTDATLFLIETKFIDLHASGKTAQSRRTQHRKKVLEQVQELKKTFSQYWKIDPIQFEGGAFITDTNPNIVERGQELNILVKAVSEQRLNEWRVQQRERLL